MLISIVTPVRNGSRTIERTLRSLQVQKGEFEHVVMDGGSTDGTDAIVEGFRGSYPVRWFSQADRSMYEAVLNGIRHCRGDILGYINADDFYTPWTLATVRSVFEMRPDVDWIVGLPSWYNEGSGVGLTTTFAPVYPRGLIRRGWFCPDWLGCIQQEAVFWRRSVWDKSEAQDLLLKYRYAADFHLWRRFAERHTLFTVGSVFACYSLSNDQLSFRFRDKYMEECGRVGRPFRTRVWGKLVNRILSILLPSLVIKPQALLR